MTTKQEQLLDDLLELDSGLTAWEMDFITNLDQNYRDQDLTDRQAETLERIGEKRL